MSRPDIVIVVLDDLRPDLRFLGYARNTAPFLTKLQRAATVFTNCHSPTGWTLPAVASILTGLDPANHGLNDHNQRHREPKLGHFLGDTYHRVGIANNGNMVSDQISQETLDSLGHHRRPEKWQKFGWDDGFDEYHWIHPSNHFRPFDIAAQSVRDNQSTAKPLFLFLHTNIVHDYNQDKPYYRDQHQWSQELHHDLRSFRDGPAIWQRPIANLSDTARVRQIKFKYDCGIRHADTKLAELFDRIDLEATIVVVLSDHGEGFLPELGRVHHCGRLHEDLLHVPLMMRLPRDVRKTVNSSGVVEQHCSTIDVVPTLLDLLGIENPGVDGHNLFGPTGHRKLSGLDRGYLFWNGSLERESYDDCAIEITSNLTYPLKTIITRRNDEQQIAEYNLAYDPGETCDLTRENEPTDFAPITFVTVVNDYDDLRNNLTASPIAQSQRHEWLIIDNRDNRKSSDICSLYCDALAQATHDLVCFVHQDLFLPAGWEARLDSALRQLEMQDPNWGIIGAVGIAADSSELVGHWCDPFKYWRQGALPCEVQSLDEQWLGLRKSSGLNFDRQLPGFHCYGMDICLQAVRQGRKSYAIDNFVWHKFRNAGGKLISRAAETPRIAQRHTDHAFRLEMARSKRYVGRKWHSRKPFRSTSMEWETDHEND